MPPIATQLFTDYTDLLRDHSAREIESASRLFAMMRETLLSLSRGFDHEAF